jgi:lysylphosphatidylglycerol synthetase-like protein (DUF2156 family)
MNKRTTSYNLGTDDELPASILKNSDSNYDSLPHSFYFKLKSKEHKSIIWINNPQYRFDLVPLEDYNKLFLKDLPIFITSCSKELAQFFSQNKFETLKAGKEAILNLSKDHFSKRSLKDLINAGFRNGEIEEIFYSEENGEILEKFKLECVHGKEPQLKHFFNDKFLPISRLFVYKDKQKKWAGGILITPKGKGKVITDLILRREHSPRGTMESLIYFIASLLKDERNDTWSLGEVPYVVDSSKFLSKEFFINFMGRRLRYAYNYLGLYNFKNKFNPEWKDIYICCKPKLTLITLLKISWLSNLAKLILKKSFKRVLFILDK